MTVKDLVRFSSDLSHHAGVESTVRRMGDRAVLKVGGTEFIFRGDGRYDGMGSDYHAALSDLVEKIDRSGETKCPDFE